MIDKEKEMKYKVKRFNDLFESTSELAEELAVLIETGDYEKRWDHESLSLFVDTTKLNKLLKTQSKVLESPMTPFKGATEDLSCFNIIISDIEIKRDKIRYMQKDMLKLNNEYKGELVLYNRLLDDAYKFSEEKLTKYDNEIQKLFSSSFERVKEIHEIIKARKGLNNE